MTADSDANDKSTAVANPRLKQDFGVPELGEKPINPVLKSGAMVHSKPFESTPEIQQRVGYPGPLIENWQQVAIDKLGELVDSIEACRYILIPVLNAVPAQTSATTSSVLVTLTICR